MRISTRGRYALRAVVDLAEEGRGGYVSLRLIARRQRLSVKYLETLFTLLVKGGVLASRRGIDGGYALSSPAERTSVYDVLSSIEGELNVVNCLGPEPRCQRIAQCRTRKLWKEVSELICRKFKSTSIKDLTRK
jgi:Rrf2 family protein